MNIQEFISHYKNHPVLFVGTGVSLRYLETSYTWDGLLKHVAFELTGKPEFYLDIKSKNEKDGVFNYSEIASNIEEEFNNILLNDRDGKFKEVNDTFYEKMESEIKLSRFKIYLSNILSNAKLKDEKKIEIAELIKIRKNIASIITTNYDKFIEDLFEFQPLIGNDILLSNPYGSVYKIHGCVSAPLKIIITGDDYKKFDDKYELIRAQLLSLFIHNPIIFMGYSIGDDNIKNLLKTIFTYVEPNSENAAKIKHNFLLVEYEKDSASQEIIGHDIDMEGFSTIRINKLKTDDFSSLYKALSELNLPVSAMDVRKVQTVFNEIIAGGKIEVKITENLDSLKNSDMILAIGSSKTISYDYQTKAEMMTNYFSIIDESNSQLLQLINKYTIQSSQYFPVFGFSSITDKIEESEKLKKQQQDLVESALQKVTESCHTDNSSIEGILQDNSVTTSNKNNAILWSLINDKVSLEDSENYLRNFDEKDTTPYRKLLCAYDLKKYNTTQTLHG